MKKKKDYINVKGLECFIVAVENEGIVVAD